VLLYFYLCLFLLFKALLVFLLEVLHLFLVVFKKLNQVEDDFASLDKQDDQLDDHCEYEGNDNGREYQSNRFQNLIAD